MVGIFILDKKGQVLDELKMKLYHLSTGPVKHDHLLKNLKSRLLFDFRIDQYVEVGVTLKDLTINWKNNALSNDDIYQLSIIVTRRLLSSQTQRKTFILANALKNIGKSKILLSIKSTSETANCLSLL